LCRGKGAVSARGYMVKVMVKVGSGTLQNMAVFLELAIRREMDSIYRLDQGMGLPSFRVTNLFAYTVIRNRATKRAPKGLRGVFEKR
jgi:hypothetical protein